MQAFPLSVKLHLTHLSLDVTFAYLPSLGLVTAQAGTQAGNELLATMFETDSGADTPSEANKYIGEGPFVFDPSASARPYRSAPSSSIEAAPKILQLSCCCCVPDGI